MHKNNQRFIEIYKELEEYLNRLVRFVPKKGQERKHFWDLINDAETKNLVIPKYKKDLQDYNQIRNLFEHEEKGGKIIVLESELEIFNNIVQKIRNPPTVYDKFKREVFTCQTSDSLLEILKVMKEEVYTHIPVYENDNFVGVLSEVSVTNWLADKKEVKLCEIKVGELKEFLINQPNEYFDFVKKDEDAYKIKERFLHEVKDRKRIGAIFITENGKKEEKLLGIITAWDIPILD